MNYTTSQPVTSHLERLVLEIKVKGDRFQRMLAMAVRADLSTAELMHLLGISHGDAFCMKWLILNDSRFAQPKLWADAHTIPDDFCAY